MSDFPSAWGDPDAAIARVNAQIKEAQERAVRASAMRQQVESVRGQAASTRREVTVTVDVSGRLVDLDIAEAGMELAPRDLARLVVTTVEQARRNAGDQSIALAAEVFGEDSIVVDRLRAEVERPIISDDTGLQKN
jgi:DNA-binding protein YbaB